MSKTSRETSRTVQSRRAAANCAPVLPYRPRDPKRYRPGIALIGCGGITKWHLRRTRRPTIDVVALCDMILERAPRRRDEFYPDAIATDSVDEVLSRDDVEVVDITTHPPERPPLVEAALRLGSTCSARSRSCSISTSASGWPTSPTKWA